MVLRTRLARKFVTFTILFITFGLQTFVLANGSSGQNFSNYYTVDDTNLSPLQNQFSDNTLTTVSKFNRSFFSLFTT